MRFSNTLAILLVTIATGPFLPRAAADLGPLIPREVFFGNPERATPRISPDGKRLAWIAPDKKNVLQVWVRTIGQNDDKMVTADKKRGIRQYFWANDNKTLLYLQDNDGDENFHLYGVDLAAGTVRDYTAFQNARATVVALEPSIPDQLLVGLNARDRSLFDVYRLTLSTGALVLDTQNPGDEGHGFARPENSIDFNARAEAFLSQCVGGRYEALTAEKVPGSTATVKVIGSK